MGMRIYYACRAIGVRAHGDYSGPGKHTCTFSVDEQDTDKFVEYLKDNNYTLAIDSANIRCSRLFKDDNRFWLARFSRR